MWRLCICTRHVKRFYSHPKCRAVFCFKTVRQCAIISRPVLNLRNAQKQLLLKYAAFYQLGNQLFTHSKKHNINRSLTSDVFKPLKDVNNFVLKGGSQTPPRDAPTCENLQTRLVVRLARSTICSVLHLLAFRFRSNPSATFAFAVAVGSWKCWLWFSGGKHYVTTSAME